MFKTLSAPIQVQWEITNWCNFKCIHCYNRWIRKKNPRKVNKSTTKLFETTVREILENKVFTVTVTGGEPLGVFGYALPYLRQLADNGIQLTLNSNLSFLTKSLAEKLRDELGIKGVLVSLPSGDSRNNDRITNSTKAHERTTRGIEVALKSGLKPMVNMVVTKGNLYDVFSTAQYVANLGIKNFSATRASAPANCPDFSSYALSLGEFRIMLNELTRVREELGMQIDSLEFYPLCSFGDDQTREIFGSRMCTAGKTTCTVSPDGAVRPCSHAPQTYGNIQNGLRDVWLLMEDWRSGAWLPEKCKTCNLKGSCSGGCKVEAFQSSGSLNGEDPYCDFSQLPVHRKKKELRLPDTTRFTVNTFLKYREEAFGGILYVSPNQWLAVETMLYRLISKRKGGSLHLEDIAKKLSVSDEEALKTVSALLSKGVLREEA